MYAEQLGVPTTVLRLFSVYGPGQVGQGTSGVVSIFIDRARRGEQLAIHAAQRRDLTFVGDVARGIRLALERPPADPRTARVYNLATGVGTSLDELARSVCRVVRSRSVIDPPTEASAEGDRVADIGRAGDELGFEPSIGVEEGLRLVAEAGRARTSNEADLTRGDGRVSPGRAADPEWAGRGQAAGSEGADR